MACIAVCADDFGLHEGINRAALQLAAAGRVQAIACMVGAAAWPAGSRALARLDGEPVDIGLHLDFTTAPMIAATRRSLPALIAGAYAGRLDERRVRAEIGAQLEAFEQALGRAPAFVDGHQHVHQLPVIREALLEVLDARSGAQRPWLRNTSSASRPGAWKPRLIEALGAAAFGRLAAQRGYPQNHGLLGVYDFTQRAPSYGQRLAAWLADATEGDLLMCHPSLPTRADDAITAARIDEYEALAGTGFSAALDEAGLSLRPMSRILAQA